MQKIVSCQLHCAGNCLICNRNFLQKRGFVFLPRLGKWQICLLHKFIWFFYACVLFVCCPIQIALHKRFSHHWVTVYVCCTCLFGLFVCSSICLFVTFPWFGFCACSICNLPILPQFSHQVTWCTCLFGLVVCSFIVAFVICQKHVICNRILPQFSYRVT